MTLYFSLNGEEHSERLEYFSVQKNYKTNETELILVFIKPNNDINYSNINNLKIILEKAEVSFTPISITSQIEFIPDRQEYGVTFFVKVEEDSDDLFNEFESY